MEVKGYFHIAICVLPFRSQPDEDTIGSKHVADMNTLQGRRSIVTPFTPYFTAQHEMYNFIIL